MRRISAALAASAFVALGAATASAGAADIDYSQAARNIIPSGQQGSIPIPDGATTQAQMYNALTPLFDHVSTADLFSDFKSEQFGLGDEGPGTVEPVPFPGVTIIRDRYAVPHVTALTHAGGVWAAGWIAAEDRGLLLQEARDNSRVAALDVPGLTAIGLIENLQDFQPSAQTEAVLSRQTQVLENAGPEGRDVLSDIDEFVTGINA
ncbi:MAG: penicillin acylase family protein, partial [Solirubrobacteraceae bacterium]